MHQSQLVKNCLKQNKAAQEELYRLFAPPMLGICYRYTKSLDDAEDVLQEGFIKVFANLNKYKSEGELGAWINRIMVNTALSYLRKHNRYRNSMNFDQPGLHPIVSEEANIRLNFNDIVELIRRLPVNYQTIFNLVALEGYSHIEVSRLLGINENTCRSQYSRARAQLISWINQEERITELKTSGLKK